MDSELFYLIIVKDLFKGVHRIWNVLTSDLLRAHSMSALYAEPYPSLFMAPMGIMFTGDRSEWKTGIVLPQMQNTSKLSWSTQHEPKI